MEKEKDLKSIRLTLDYPTEEGNYTTKELTVKVSNAKPKKTFGKGFRDHFLTMQILFSLEVPEFIHAALKGNTVGQKKLGVISGGDARKYEEDFPKTIKSITLEGLTEQWVQIVIDYIWLKEIEKKELTKVIFYQFNNSSKPTKSLWNGLPLGNAASLNYVFAVGYISTGKTEVYRFNDQKKMVNSSHDRDFYACKYITWSEKREQFFTRLKELFEKQMRDMAEFETNLTEEKINLFIEAKGNMLALNGSNS